MGRPVASRNRAPYPKTRHKNFYWQLVSSEFAAELQAFKGAHNRVLVGKAPSIEWPRTFEGFWLFLKEVGQIPPGMKKPSLGRKLHAKGYQTGNVEWEEHAANSIKRKGTRYES